MPAAVMFCCYMVHGAAVLHGPCRAGQQTPLAAQRQEPVHVTVLVAFMGPGPRIAKYGWQRALLVLRMPRLVMSAAGPLAYLCIWRVFWLARWTKHVLGRGKPLDS
jgi:hypothetical protein